MPDVWRHRAVHEPDLREQGKSAVTRSAVEAVAMLRGAAERLTKLAAAVPPGPWYVESNTREGWAISSYERIGTSGYYWVKVASGVNDDAASAPHDVVRWFAFANPAWADPIRNILVEAAEELESGISVGHNLTPSYMSEVRLAEVINDFPG